MVRYVMVILLALLIDGSQALLSAGFLGFGALASAVTAGVATPVALPISVGLGFATDVCLSATLGSGLLLLLAYNRMFYANYAFGGGIVELIPGFDVVPAWTVMAISCVVRKMKEEGRLKGIGGLSGKILPVASIVGAGAAIAGGAKQLTLQRAVGDNQSGNTQESVKKPVVSTELKNIDGIRAPRNQPANDNISAESLQYAV